MGELDLATLEIEQQILRLDVPVADAHQVEVLEA